MIGLRDSVSEVRLWSLMAAKTAGIRDREMGRAIEENLMDTHWTNRHAAVTALRSFGAEVAFSFPTL